MGRSLGYYGIKINGFDYSNQLIRDMVETWGDDLGQLDEKSTLMLISALSQSLVQEDDSQLDPNVAEAVRRIDELSRHDKISLIQALAN
jgi:KaiC/GvpD/RAD55 family RecA-like ATPase